MEKHSLSDSSLITFQSYNPYEGMSHVPHVTRIVSRETLHLIKHLRTQGYNVLVFPEDGTKLNYFVEKGIREVLSDPIIMACINIPLAIATGLLTNRIQEAISRKRKRPPISQKTAVIEISEDGTTLRFDGLGNPVSDQQFAMMLSMMEDRSKRWQATHKVQSPYVDRPFPVYLEHSQSIVGWCRLSLGDTALHADTIITDEETRRRVKTKELKGFSIGGIVHNSRCSVCKGHYTDCNHIAGNIYDGEECITEILGIHLSEVSIVSQPANPGCYINDKLKPKPKVINSIDTQLAMIGISAHRYER